MPDLFIPPEGAMQFEVTLPALEDGTPVRCEVFWLSGKLGNPAVCDRCVGPRMQVITETLSAYIKAVHKANCHNPNTPSVCKCLGRIIE